MKIQRGLEGKCNCSYTSASDLFIFYCALCLFHNIGPVCVKCLCEMFLWMVYAGCLCGMFIWNFYIVLILMFISQRQTCLCEMFVWDVYGKCLCGMFIWNVYQSFSPPHVYFVTSDLFVWKPFHWRPAGEVSLVWYQGQSPNLEK